MTIVFGILGGQLDLRPLVETYKQKYFIISTITYEVLQLI